MISNNVNQIKKESAIRFSIFILAPQKGANFAKSVKKMY